MRSELSGAYVGSAVALMVLLSSCGNGGAVPTIASLPRDAQIVKFARQGDVSKSSHISVCFSYVDSVCVKTLCELENEGWTARQIVEKLRPATSIVENSQCLIPNAHAVSSFSAALGGMTYWSRIPPDDEAVQIEDVLLGTVRVQDASGTPIGGVPLVLFKDGVAFADGLSRSHDGLASFFGAPTHDTHSWAIECCYPLVGPRLVVAAGPSGCFEEVITLAPAQLTVELNCATSTQRDRPMLVTLVDGDVSSDNARRLTYSTVLRRAVPACRAWTENGIATFRGIAVDQRRLMVHVTNLQGRVIAMGYAADLRSESGSVKIDVPQMVDIIMDVVGFDGLHVPYYEAVVEVEGERAERASAFGDHDGRAITSLPLECSGEPWIVGLSRPGALDVVNVGVAVPQLQDGQSVVVLNLDLRRQRFVRQLTLSRGEQRLPRVAVSFEKQPIDDGTWFEPYAPTVLSDSRGSVRISHSSEGPSSVCATFRVLPTDTIARVSDAADLHSHSLRVIWGRY